MLAIGAFLFVWFSSAEPRHGLLEPSDPAIVARGKAIYLEQCASCHGENLEGQANWKSRDDDGYMPAPPHDETGHTWHHSDSLLFDLTKYGLAKISGLEDYETRMPVYEEELSDAEIVAVLSYIKSRWPAELRQRHDELNKQQNAQNKK